ncbi:hypothetical protein MOK15_19110 [Sphingobium sp. BYY-5]|uniref:hypothetical protein n=1 Tax=Sphingobium sp. BYY-5 TaxID=2926400 RepID=UPI001FA788B2|nr:hypothetical protein [Sphingobium sp. BYY-5]MCI4592195.1 hypothetical protein [Sphingobium sp. BYY-5]
MAISELLRGASIKAKRYLEALAWMADYDPIEEQRRWIAGLEERIEAGLPSAQEQFANRPTQT